MLLWRLYFCFLLLLCTRTVRTALKTWRHNTNFSNPDNWSLGRVPCPLDRVSFSFRKLPVLLPEGTHEFKRVCLPYDGILLLPINGEIRITDRHKKAFPDCKGGDNVFLRSGVKAWLDPENWISETGPVAPIPHMERIPCRYDTAVFPGDASIGVGLPEMPVSVSSIRFGFFDLSADDWSDTLRSINGLRLLEGPASLRELLVEISGRPCTEAVGCPCFPMRMDAYSQKRDLFENVVCRYGRSQCEADGPPPCYSPVFPHGHCCAICGSYLKLDFDPLRFSLSDLRQLVERATEQSSSDVQIHVSTLSDSQAHVVVVDRGDYKGDSVPFGNDLYDMLNNNWELGITAVQLFTAGDVMTPNSWLRIVGMIFGTLLAVLVVMGTIFLAFVVYRDRMPLSIMDKGGFMFARFENMEEAVQVLPFPDTPRYDDQDEPSLSKAFDNPMYGKTKGRDKAQMDDNSDGKATQENPVYSELQRRHEEIDEAEEIAEMKEMTSTKEDVQEELVEIDIDEVAKTESDQYQ